MKRRQQQTVSIDRKAVFLCKHCDWGQDGYIHALVDTFRRKIVKTGDGEAPPFVEAGIFVWCRTGQPDRVSVKPCQVLYSPAHKDHCRVWHLQFLVISLPYSLNAVRYSAFGCISSYRILDVCKCWKYSQQRKA
ncbi:MAG: hypothetical protein K6A82_08670 [Prevotella sp.]|nr:hypothetical protein [Prevotella sp.]